MDNIVLWLEKLGLGHYSHLFLEHGIDRNGMRTLTDADLQKIGIPEDQRKKLLASAAEQEVPDFSSSDPSHDPPRVRDVRKAERRFLTIMFVDIVDSTGLAQRLEPEDLAQLLNAFHEICGRILNRFGGCVAKDLGDGLGAYFGWPESHEQDAERAVLASLEIIEAIKTIPCAAGARLQVRTGIAQDRSSSVMSCGRRIHWCTRCSVNCQVSRPGYCPHAGQTPSWSLRKRTG